MTPIETHSHAHVHAVHARTGGASSRIPGVLGFNWYTHTYDTHARDIHTYDTHTYDAHTHAHIYTYTHAMYARTGGASSFILGVLGSNWYTHTHGTHTYGHIHMIHIHMRYSYIHTQCMHVPEERALGSSGCWGSNLIASPWASEGLAGPWSTQSGMAYKSVYACISICRSVRVWWIFICVGTRWALIHTVWYGIQVSMWMYLC